MQKRKSLITAGVNKNWYSHCDNSGDVPQKTTNITIT